MIKLLFSSKFYDRITNNKCTPALGGLGYTKLCLGSHLLHSFVPPQFGQGTFATTQNPIPCPNRYLPRMLCNSSIFLIKNKFYNLNKLEPIYPITHIVIYSFFIFLFSFFILLIQSPSKNEPPQSASAHSQSL